MKPISVTVEEMYAGTEEGYLAFLVVLDESLNPRSPDVLYEKFGQLGPTPDSVVLDIGCRYGAQACELAQRFGCRVVGVDLVRDNLLHAPKRIAEKGVGQSVQVIQGDIQQLPLPAQSFDFIWCRDVLTHVPDLLQVFAACARVLKPNGQMLIFSMFMTDLISDEEAAALCAPLASQPENMTRAYFEQAFSGAGFTLVEADTLSSEWREYGEESGTMTTSKQLLRIARMRRNREQLVAQFGEKEYVSELANCHWGVYQMLGKLSPVIYTLEKKS